MNSCRDLFNEMAEEHFNPSRELQSLSPKTNEKCTETIERTKKNNGGHRKELSSNLVRPRKEDE